MGAAFVINFFFSNNKVYLMDLMTETIEMDCQLTSFFVVDHG